MLQFKMFYRIFCRHVCPNPNILYRARTYSKKPNPFIKTWDVISKDIPLFGGNKKASVYPQHTDIVVIGGGFIGSSVAYWLKSRASEGLSVVVLEKDLTYKEAQNNVSLGTVIQHYSLPENIYLAQYAADFLRNTKELLNADVDIQYCPYGHLVLASTKYADKLEENVAIQRELGVTNELLTVDEINRRYPWINTEDIQLGCIGNECEGSFNSWAFLKGLINKSQDLGAIYVNAEVTGFNLEEQRDMLMEGVAPGRFKKINEVIFKTEDDEEHTIKFAACILAAGNKSGEIAKLAQVGTGEGLLRVPLPIESRECKVYSVEECAKETGMNTPIVTDTSGLCIRRNGLDTNLLYGHIPLLTYDTKLQENEYHNDIILPSLINRIPKCKNASISTFTTELYDYNKYDESGILGPHPYYNNLYIATGFGKQGCAHAPGIGRAIAEAIIDSHYTTIDLTRLTFDRVFTDQPLVEFNIY